MSITIRSLDNTHTYNSSVYIVYNLRSVQVGSSLYNQTLYRVRILGRNADKSLIHSHLYSLALDLYFFKLTQPLTVSVKEKGGKPDRKL